jgi:hypothetical protein
MSQLEEKQCFSGDVCDSMRDNAQLFSGEEGIRTPLENAYELPFFQDDSAENSALALNDPSLLLIVNTWPTLPEAIKAAILAMVEHANTKKNS